MTCRECRRVDCANPAACELERVRRERNEAVELLRDVLKLGAGICEDCQGECGWDCGDAVKFLARIDARAGKGEGHGK